MVDGLQRFQAIEWCGVACQLRSPEEHPVILSLRDPLMSTVCISFFWSFSSIET